MNIPGSKSECGTAKRYFVQNTNCYPLLLLVIGLGMVVGVSVLASPAPAPLLLSPANSTTNVDPDPTLSWRWIDDLIVNGSFDSGLSPGWYTGGSNPTLWQVYVTPTNKWATTYIPNSSTSSGQLIQDIYIPADATSATLQWKERVWNLTPSLIGRLRVLLVKDGGAVAKLEDATGSPSPTWLSRSTNLIAYAGWSLQVVIQADTYSPLAVNSWFADVDAFTLTCEHSSTPQFLVYASKSPLLRSTDQVGVTTNLSFSSVALAPYSTYYWAVASVRDGVMNYSATNRFTTGERVLPQVTVAGLTGNTVRLQFLSRTNRFYAFEEMDVLDPNGTWWDATGAEQGTGTFMEMQVLQPSGGAAFWRLRVSP